MTKLTFGKGNVKLAAHIATFSLPAGKTCPGAHQCHSYVVKRDGARRVVDGPQTTFRCYAASQEALYTSVYDSRAANLKVLREALGNGNAVELIHKSLPPASHIRVHVSGDFFSPEYFRAWMKVAKLNPSKVFYAYTKSIKIWLRNRRHVPPNFILTASLGGRWDHLVIKHGLRTVKVVWAEKEAKVLNLPIDKDDSKALRPDGNFALLLHGTQPVGSAAGVAWGKLRKKKLRKTGKMGYSRRLPTL
jgi:hypothetical protein